MHHGLVAFVICPVSDCHLRIAPTERMYATDFLTRRPMTLDDLPLHIHFVTRLRGSKHRDPNAPLFTIKMAVHVECWPNYVAENLSKRNCLPCDQPKQHRSHPGRYMNCEGWRALLWNAAGVSVGHTTRLGIGKHWRPWCKICAAQGSSMDN